MRLTNVTSSQIVAVGYNPITKEMQVKFKAYKQGGEEPTYSYPDVPSAEHAALMASPSIGSHFHKHFRKTYKGVKLA